MRFRIAFAGIAILLLAGCVTNEPLRQPRAFAWDGLGRDPNKPPVKSRSLTPAEVRQDAQNAEREKILATPRPYSNAWWAIHDEMEAARDRQLNSKLAICRGCITPEEEARGSLP